MYVTDRERKSVYRKGYIVVVRERMEVYKDWELDPMCDCCPAQNIWKHSGEWSIEVRRVYVENDERQIDGKWIPRNTIWTSGEAFSKVDRLSEETVDELWNRLNTESLTMNSVKELFLDAELNAEAIRLMR